MRGGRPSPTACSVWRHMPGKKARASLSCARATRVCTWQERAPTVTCCSVSTAYSIPIRPPAEARAATPDPATNWTRQAREIVDDLQRRSAFIYWTDFLLSAGAAWLLAVLFFRAPGWGPLALLELLGAAILFFRAGTFIHEIVHFRDGELKWFARAWNLGMGIPMLMPWIIYRNHVDHHSVRYFGTPDDGEYLPLAAAPRSETIKYVAQVIVLPL